MNCSWKIIDTAYEKLILILQLVSYFVVRLSDLVIYTSICWTHAKHFP